MSTLGTTVLTLSDWAKRLDPDGKTAQIVELLGQTNSMLEDMMWKEGNLPTGHRVTQRTGLPTVYWRLINQAIATSKSTTAQVDEQTGMLHSWSEIDKDEAELNGNVNAYRFSEAQAHLEAINQEMQQTLIYGSAANPEEFVGFANRYSDLSGGNSANILDAGGTGAALSSIYLAGWGDRSVFGIFPKGSKAGIEHKDWGLSVVEGSTGIGGTRLEAYRDHWCWKAGLCLKDWRYVVRIANVDTAEMAAFTGAQQLTDYATLVYNLMCRAIDRMPTMSGIRPVFYANRSVLSLLRVMASEKNSSAVTIQEGQSQFGKDIWTTRFHGIPVRLVDQLTLTESQVT